MKRRGSKFAHSAGAIARARDVERWQLHQIHAGVAELDRGRSVPHAAVVMWLRSWASGMSEERLARDHRRLWRAVRDEEGCGSVAAENGRAVPGTRL